MGLNVFVVSEPIIFWQGIKTPKGATRDLYGYISDKEIRRLKESSLLLELKQLSMLDSGDHMVFNKKQALMLEQDLRILKQNNNTNLKMVEIIQKAIDHTKVKKELYIKFDAE